MSTSELRRSAPAAYERACTLPEPQPGHPSWSIRMRGATDEWGRFMRRGEISIRQEAEE
ncbi:hypothetical protein ACIRUY_17740 [Streptomyces erythrochromogenes]|uniref:hypothetical protein n=1 Tax=Streptomyces erythrochromogenes TaxID=285574 RepID=UPI00382C80E8